MRVVGHWSDLPDGSCPRLAAAVLNDEWLSAIGGGIYGIYDIYGPGGSDQKAEAVLTVFFF